MGGGASKKADQATEVLRQRSVQRRHRLLFGESRPFESVGPRDQFRAPMEEEDLVVQRLGNCDELRRNLEAIQREGDDGFLRDHALQVLPIDPRLPDAQPIYRRLFHLAQAQLIALPRRKLLTCYEVLGLVGLVAKGSSEEVLELLFCVFDADQDDSVGLADLEVTIDAFLQLPEALELPEAEAKDFRTLDARKRKAEVLAMAKKALQEFGGEESEPEEEVPPPSEGKPQQVDLVSSQVSTSSKVAEPGKTEPPPPRGGLCASKPKETDEDPKPKAKAGGLCGSKKAKTPPPKEALVEDEKGKDEPEKAEKAEEKAEQAEEKAEQAEEKKKEEVKAKAKAKAKPKRPRRALCGAAPPLRLSYRQWSRWLLSLDVLPPALADAAVLASRPPGPTTPEVEGPLAPTPAFPQSPAQSDDNTPETPGVSMKQPFLQPST